jgi:hypothetical protein
VYWLGTVAQGLSRFHRVSTGSAEPALDFANRELGVRKRSVVSDVAHDKDLARRCDTTRRGPTLRDEDVPTLRATTPSRLAAFLPAPRLLRRLG